MANMRIGIDVSFSNLNPLPPAIYSVEIDSGFDFLPGIRKIVFYLRTEQSPHWE